jgi:hypothetical protein
VVKFAEAQLHIFMISSEAGIAPVTVDAFTVVFTVRLSGLVGSILALLSELWVSDVTSGAGGGSSALTVEKAIAVVVEVVSSSVPRVVSRNDILLPSKARLSWVLNTTLTKPSRR